MSLRWTSFLVIIGLTGAITGNLLAQSDLSDLLKPKKTKPAGGPPKATINVTAEPTKSGTVTIAVTVDVPKGYHIYGTDGDFGGRTQIRIDTPGLTPLGERFIPDQPGKTAVDPDLKVEVTKHTGTVTWTREFRFPDDAGGDGAFDVKGQVEGQYCSGAEDGGLCVQLKHPFGITVLTGPASSATGPKFVATIKPERKGAPNPDPVEYTVQLSPTNAAKGDTVTLSLTAKLRSGWHTFSLTQTDIGGSPTEIDVGELRNLEAIDDTFTPSKPPQKESGDMGNVLETHHDEVTWTRKFRAIGKKPGDYRLSGEITYQLCDSRQCLQVNVVPFVVGQVAEEPASPFAQTAPDDPPSPFAQVEAMEPLPAVGPEVSLPKEEPVVARAAPAPKPEEASWVPFLLLCISGGYFAVLTPCSFPMIPITVSFFLKQSEKEHKRPWLLALVYCGTIILTFLAIGLVLSFFLGKTSSNDLANSSPLNWFLGTILVAFALNMLGAFEIRVPSSWLNWTSSRGSSGGYVGAIFMALTFTLTSFTCTFAILGGLVTQASNGQLLRPALGMLVFGTAFASPFFVLALLPQLLKKMPKSGGWMNAVKVVLGLIELGAAVKFFSIADNPNPILFDYVTVMIIWMVIALAMGLYLLGLYRFEHDSPEGPIPLGSALTSMACLVLAGLLGYLTLYPDRATGVLMENIVSFAPPKFDAPVAAPQLAVGTTRSTDNQPAVEHHGLRFVMDYHYAFEVARRERRPVMLDFTGVNCANCRKMEKVMGRPENHERLQKFVTAALSVDKIPIIQDTDLKQRMLAENRALQDKLLNDSSMPNYAIVTPDGELLASHIGYNEGNEFTEFLNEGWQKWQARSQTASR